MQYVLCNYNFKNGSSHNSIASVINFFLKIFVVIFFYFDEKKVVILSNFVVIFGLIHSLTLLGVLLLGIQQRLQSLDYDLQDNVDRLDSVDMLDIIVDVF